ncbi:fused isobutyryl-CoA mutase/GTPase IcmF [Paenactinomyces guangxiensis]|uniref:Fused isobutyryl-CoA mutase n=1 Tax=Paenactinomyces guangxiensis TaxID=1490290 RepID=A0A7W1WQ55_9BACL|nr:fused isobutyryl-CoA mutase/GTPase IcmF [Paenactinomyces guangxiensis]MBA4494033.1 methylmalonyl-CoA mutase family protein [Paenactinomyces guangxiensis]MBH8591222.1 methylmalonyl-CoA mutase family protein [Paenactinomyces guangxiensis]
METEIYRPKHAVRFVTAASLFDGHDASINLFRRLLQASGVEVIHMGHNRSVDEIVEAAIQEDVQGIAVSSYQGGHMEFFKYMVDLLKERGASHIRVFGGGGGVIVPREIRELESYGVSKVFSPQDGRNLGLQGIINCMVRETDFPVVREISWELDALKAGDKRAIARLLTYAEEAAENEQIRETAATLFADLIHTSDTDTAIPVIGITGTGGAGKSSLTDELVRRFLHDFPDKKIAVLSIDPSKQKTGGALLGDRIRMNAVHHPRAYMRSLATRRTRSELSGAIRESIAVMKRAGYDCILVETSGIGQGNADVVQVSDLSVYVMTAEFGAPSQLEKIEMLDYADLVAINKFDRKGSEDALRDVKKQYRRNHNLFHVPDDEIPVYGTMASRFNDPGTNIFYRALIDKINEKMGLSWNSSLDVTGQKMELRYIIPPERTYYLRDISNTVRKYHEESKQQAEVASQLYQIRGTRQLLDQAGNDQTLTVQLDEVEQKTVEKLTPENKRMLEEWPKIAEKYRGDTFVTRIRDKEISTPLYTETLSGSRIPKVALPKYKDWGELIRWLHKENLPGHFPFTAGVFPFKRADEDPKRQFAGEGTPERTNKRFHYLSKNDTAKRLSTAFDSVTLYGEDPAERPDIYGKVGESGVSICTLEDMKKLYEGFDLCSPNTSVSMTINGPAPIILAMFFNTAIEQQLEKFRQEQGREPSDQEAEQIRARTLQTVRGTVQADILKEDQGQNTCIFSTEFALKLMGDIQQYFIDHGVRNYYSVSISGYHIAEAGANPISQLAFTLANAFTYVEYYLSRGMKIDQFAPNLSFFFSNGLDAEYSVIGRVARRIWAIVMKKLYGANERSQKLKYHIQTSGRSLHAQEIDFNDIRTTLQALMAIYDQCNSLHTNAYDEAITTPTEESVRRAMAIQLIITKELGLAKNENPLQGSFIIDELTDLVEEAVLKEFERISDRGGVLGAMETQYQRGKIQEESLYYETKKHSGELPIIGVNTFENPTPPDEVEIELTRATPEEKQSQIERLRRFHENHREEAAKALERLKQVAQEDGNLFAELMETVKVASLGQITHALYEVGGQYRRNM